MTVAVAAAMSGLATTAGWAQGTEEQRSACFSDAFRLCSAYIPDETAIEKCLEYNKVSLAPACRAQFDTPETPPARARRATR